LKNSKAGKAMAFLAVSTNQKVTEKIEKADKKKEGA